MRIKLRLSQTSRFRILSWSSIVKEPHSYIHRRIDNTAKLRVIKTNTSDNSLRRVFHPMLNSHNRSSTLSFKPSVKVICLSLSAQPVAGTHRATLERQAVSTNPRSLREVKLAQPNLLEAPSHKRTQVVTINSTSALKQSSSIPHPKDRPRLRNGTRATRSLSQTVAPYLPRR